MIKNLPANAGDTASISGPRRSPGEGNVNPLHVLVTKYQKFTFIHGFSFHGFGHRHQSWPKNMKLKIPEMTNACFKLCVIRSSVIKPVPFYIITPGIPVSTSSAPDIHHQHCHGSMVQDYPKQMIFPLTYCQKISSCLTLHHHDYVIHLVHLIM